MESQYIFMPRRLFIDSLIQTNTFGLSIRTAQLEYAHGFGALSSLDRIPMTKLFPKKIGAPES
jgi:hypothetical protein